MRIRTDGKFAHRQDVIEHAQEWWGVNKSEALLRSAEFAPRVEPRVRAVLEREDLTTAQKREIAETLSVPGVLEFDVEESVTVEK